MSLINKWNCKTKKYDICEIPDDWQIELYTENMEKIINCCQCGAAVKYGESYTSLEVHNDYGLGFAVCEKCYYEEWKRRKENEKVEEIK